MVIRSAAEAPLPPLAGPAPPVAAGLATARWDVARVAVTVGLIGGLLGTLMTVGADARWLAALGGRIADTGSIPRGVPFAAAPTAHWVNSLVLAELAFHGLESAFGDRGLILANLVALLVAFTILARDARADGAPAWGVVSALWLVAIGALGSLAIARIQLFSIVLLPALVALLRAEDRAPSRRIWLAVPLLALWSNLHGAVLAGLALLWAYLLLSRLRRDPRTAVAVALAGLVALCLTPAGISTLDYFRGLLVNVAAQRGVGQWAPLGLTGTDLVLIAAAAVLAVRFGRSRPAGWELAVAAGLAVLTVKASRDGIWLLFFLMGPAARRTRVRRDWNGLVPLAAAGAVVMLGLAVARPVRSGGASSGMLHAALRLAHGSPILADGIPAEQVALAGGRIWAGNPLDAFSRRVQNQYVDWLSGDRAGRSALNAPGVRVVLVTRGSSAGALTRRDPAFRAAAADSSAVVYERSP